jgi:RHS repeat-associated protein
MAEQHSLTEDYETPYKFNGKELDAETGFYYYGARYYNPRVSVWLSVDPLMQDFPYANPYNYCLQNPINLIDPTGMSPDSTHIDECGNVIAVFDDGDYGVYQHGSNADGKTPTEYMISKRHSKLGTSAGGIKVGETFTSLGFADFDLYQSDNVIKPAVDAVIDLKSTWATEQVKNILGNFPSLLEYADKARGHHEWDLKAHTPNGNRYFGSLLYGKYASARDAGNFAAGAVAEMQPFIPNAIPDYGFGVYSQSGNNVIRSMMIVWAQIANLDFKGMKNSAMNGENPLSKAGIEAGKKYYKKYILKPLKK